MKKQQLFLRISLLFFLMYLSLLRVVVTTKTRYNDNDNDRNQIKVGSETSSKFQNTTTTWKKALLCAIVKDEEAYIDEWVDYHHALGFDHFRIYDNSEKFEMKQWGDEKGDHIEMIHWPEVGSQKMAYLDCAKREALLKNTTADDATWVAFFDVDEFLVLRKHDNLHDFLVEHLQGGALAINWIFMEPTEKDLLYSPLPVTKRFQYRKRVNSTMFKSIVKLDDMYTMGIKPNTGVHKIGLKDNTEGQHDTKGRYFEEHNNVYGGAYDVSVLYHFHMKSYKEYVAKRLRGDSIKILRGDVDQKIDEAMKDFDKAITATAQRNSTTNVTIGAELVFDDSVWEAMKKFVPKYAIFDNEEWS